MNSLTLKDELHRHRKRYRQALTEELDRLREELVALGVERIILFGSMLHDAADLTSDLDLIVVWDTQLDFVTRTAELYRRLKPRVAVDLLVYTPEEFEEMADRPFVRYAVTEGRVLYEA